MSLFPFRKGYPFFLARRLSLSSGGRKASPAVRVAVVAVALSVVVMLAAVAIVTGFKREITSRLEGFNSDLTITVAPASGMEDNNIVTLSSTIAGILDENPAVKDYSLQISAPAILKTPDEFKGMYLRSLSGLGLEQLLGKSLEEGKLPDFVKNPDAMESDSVARQILIPRAAADRLSLKAGDKIDVYFITDEVRVRRLFVTGVYNSHFETYDDVFCFGSPALLREIGNIAPQQGTSITVFTGDLDSSAADAGALQYEFDKAVAEGRLFKPLKVSALRDTSGNFMSWLELLDMNVLVVLTLMTFVACITLVSGMLIVIVDKRRFIALMKALGMPASKLRSVFVYLSMRVTLLGLIIGDIVGVGLLWLQRETHFIPLDADSYYIDFVPVELDWQSLLFLNLGVLLISYLVLILPARFVGSISPAATLSTE